MYQIVLAARAHSHLVGPVLALDLLSHRVSQGTLATLSPSRIEDVPLEIWELIKRKLYAAAIRRELRAWLRGMTCPDCDAAGLASLGPMKPKKKGKKFKRWSQWKEPTCPSGLPGRLRARGGRTAGGLAEKDRNTPRCVRSRCRRSTASPSPTPLSTLQPTITSPFRPSLSPSVLITPTERLFTTSRSTSTTTTGGPSSTTATLSLELLLSRPDERRFVALAADYHLEIVHRPAPTFLAPGSLGKETVGKNEETQAGEEEDAAKLRDAARQTREAQKRPAWRILTMGLSQT